MYFQFLLRFLSLENTIIMLTHIQLSLYLTE